jgi:hypothetical protein
MAAVPLAAWLLRLNSCWPGRPDLEKHLDQHMGALIVHTARQVPRSYCVHSIILDVYDKDSNAQF